MRLFCVFGEAGQKTSQVVCRLLLSFLNEFRECLRCNAVIIGISAVFFISLIRLR